MLANIKPLFALTAADLMSQALVLVPQEMSMKGAAHLLKQAQVGGAPVVDDNGHCIGVLSATDFIDVADKGGSGKGCEPAEDGCRAWTIVEAEGEMEQRVQHFMTKNPVMVPPSTNIGELARMMLDAHIHRIIVVDEAGHPRGIVSSTDILAAVARAYQIENMEPEGGSFDLPEPVDASQVGVF